jgi:hypothetical protein
MKRRLARGAAVGIMVLILFVTPLSAVLSRPGQFEVYFPAFSSFDHPLTVALDDRTGLVRGLAVTAVPMGLPNPVANSGPDARVLIVTLDGSSCDDLTQLIVERVDGGYRLTAKTLEGGCSMGTGMTRSVAISLWSPVDAATVTLESLD